MRNKRLIRFLAMTLLVSMVSHIAAPLSLYALTTGPSQPEVQSFEPAGTSDMVDLFTGDFNYNIPLLNVGDYPINLSYHSGIGMDQEASWVGLGWNINPGVINRNMRGLPDDFSGDAITKEVYTKPNKTYGITYGGSLEVIGLDKIGASLSLDASLTIRYNNYRGMGFAIGIGPRLSSFQEAKGKLNVGLGLSLDSQDGVGVNTNVSFSASYSKKQSGDDKGGYSIDGVVGAGLGASFNSRTGLKELSFGVNHGMGVQHLDKAGNVVKSGAGGMGLNGSFISLGSPTYIPSQDFPQNSFGLNLKASVGGAVFFVFPGASFSGFYSRQKFDHTSSATESYGFLYAHKSSSSSLQDFNREKDGAFTIYKPNLPVTNFTYDMYSVSGQGISGMYRLHRSDVGVLHDRSSSGTSGGGNIGAEFGAGNLGHFGADITVNYSVTRDGKWTDGNDAYRFMDFSGSRPGRYDYEPAYFKQSGEMTVQEDTEDYYAKIGETDAVRLNLKNEKQLDSYMTRVRKTPAIASVAGSQVAKTKQDINGAIYRKTRDKRNQAISYLTAEEASHFALDTKIKYYDVSGSRQTLDRVGGHRKAHHISEITALRPDGTRYVYGIPAYNNEQHEVTFNAGGNTGNADDLVSYTPGGHDKVENGKGNDHYYNSVKTPGYAHSYLLTDILSADYVDVTGNGISDDDLGSFTKIHYKRTSGSYQWRTPFQENKASFNEGLKSDSGSPNKDDKGSYVYGSKEIWYVHSIETKNHIAIFHTSSRLDGLGVSQRSGGASIEPGSEEMSYKLDKIVLYSKLDYEKNGANAEKIQTVHFEYDYSLCQLIPNTKSISPGGKGKLTLKKVYFTYGTSEKGRLNAYTFNYSSFNPTYRMKNVDRWGNFKRNLTGGFQNGDFPYTYQVADSANKWVSAWELSEIKLPSGGKINIQYESDDYAYVQDKRAMQMFQVAGAGASDSYGNASTSDLITGTTNNQYIFFKRDLSLSLPSGFTDRQEHIRKYYLSDISDLYFKFFVQLKGGSQNTGTREYVPGYADIEAYGVASDNSDYFYVKLKNVDAAKIQPVHAVTKSAWGFARLYTPALVFPGYDAKDDAFSALTGLFGRGGTIDQFISGIDKTFRDEGHGMKFVASKSFIRLRNPLGKKYGGGSRVKQITMTDNWQHLTGDNTQSNAEYGQVYTYTKYDNDLGREVSSGVAAYEPMLGGDENPWRVPVAWSDKSKKWLPSEDHYVEEPMGESFFPSPVVGYSKVTVRSYLPPGVSVNRTGTGTTVHEFYTAQDFPVLITDTGVDTKTSPEHRLGNIFGIEVQNQLAASQGYAIELNDMHGKPKAELSFAQNKTTPYSKVEYKYKTQPNNAKQLNNTVSVILANGSVVEREVGREIDFVTDMREQITQSYNVGVSSQVDVAIIPVPFLPFPLPIPSGFPNFATQVTSFRSAVTTKVIQRFGILEKTIASQEGSTVVTENLAWDGESGEVLLNKIQNEFGDWVYNLTYPSHWAYKGMGPAYSNIGVSVSDIVVTNDWLGSIATLPNSTAYQLFCEGDEVAVLGGSSVEYAWVTAMAGANKLRLMDRYGNAIEAGSSRTLKILRSGHRNMHTLPIATVTSLTDPRSGGQIVINTASKVLQASAGEFSDEWQNYCGGQNCSNPDASCLESGKKANFYAAGLKGNWRQKKSLSYVSTRKQSTPVDLRNDGYFESFSSYWKKPTSGKIWTADKSNSSWTWKQEVTKYDPYGKEIENKDPLSRYSAALYGYNNTLPVIVAQNARYYEVGFQGFEDGDYEDSLYYGSCKLWPHFSVGESEMVCNTITNATAHSGSYSLQIGDTCQKASIYRPVKGNTSAGVYTVLGVPLPFVQASANCIETMSLEADKKYVVNTWTRVDKRFLISNLLWKEAEAYNSYVEIVFLSPCSELGSVQFHPSGIRIDGWQKIYGEFVIPESIDGQPVTAIRIDMVGVSGSTSTTPILQEGGSVLAPVPYRHVAFFDDLRIFPFDAMVKSYVYDPKTLRLRAELDNNNYATIYEYDQQGNLVRVKRETERGIQTINENRQNLPKFQP